MSVREKGRIYFDCHDQAFEPFGAFDVLINLKVLSGRRLAFSMDLDHLRLHHVSIWKQSSSKPHHSPKALGL